MSLNALENFIRHLQAQNKSVHTVSNYQRDIEDFLGFYLADEVDGDQPEEGLQNTIKQFSDWRIIDSQSIRAFWHIESRTA